MLGCSGARVLGWRSPWLALLEVEYRGQDADSVLFGRGVLRRRRLRHGLHESKGRRTCEVHRVRRRGQVGGGRVRRLAEGDRRGAAEAHFKIFDNPIAIASDAVDVLSGAAHTVKNFFENAGNASTAVQSTSLLITRSL